MHFGSCDMPGALGSVLLSLVLLGAAGCGHSEEEWQAMLREQEALRRGCASGQGPAPETGPAGGSAPGCGRDLDCKGDRVCSAGRCVPPER